MYNILVIAPGLIPSVNIGIIRPLIALKRNKEINLRINLIKYEPNFLIEKNIAWADFVVFCRNTEISDLRYINICQKYQKKFIYEIDDNFFKIPLSTHVGNYHRYFSRLYALTKFLRHASNVRVFSPVMFGEVSKYSSVVDIVPTYFDFSLLDGKLSSNKSDKIRIVYPTGRIDEVVLENLVFSVIKKVLELYGDRVEFCLYHKNLPDIFKYSKNVKLLNGNNSYDKFIMDFSSEYFDIGIAPGIDTEFFRSKTNNKYREFGACGIAGVYSRCEPYSSCIEDGHNGLLADFTYESWLEKIVGLVENTKLRSSIVDNAKLDVKVNYSFEGSLDSWRKSFSFVHEQPLSEVIETKNLFNQINVFRAERQEYLTATEIILNHISDDFSIPIKFFSFADVFLHDYSRCWNVFIIEKIEDLASVELFNDLNLPYLCFDVSNLKYNKDIIREKLSTISSGKQKLILYSQTADDGVKKRVFDVAGNVDIFRFQSDLKKALYDADGFGVMLLEWMGLVTVNVRPTRLRIIASSVRRKFDELLMFRRVKTLFQFYKIKFLNRT